MPLATVMPPLLVRSCACLFLLVSFAPFAQATDVWVGGAVEGGVTVGADGAGGVAIAPTIAQAEVDFRLGTDLIFVRVDLDAHVDPANLAGGLTAPVPPEWAMVQIGREKYHLRLGVTNPNIGLQQWEEWQNYLPSYSLTWAAQPSQILGAEPGIDFDDGTSLFVYAGYDLAWGGLQLPVRGAQPGEGGSLFPSSGGLTAGLGFSRSADSYYASLDVSAYPLAGYDYYASFGCFELYPSDLLTLSLDGGGGVAAGSGFAGGQFQVALTPSDFISPAVRVEALYDPDDFLGLPMATASIGGRITPLEFATISLEGKSSFYNGAPAQLSGVLIVSVFRPEPDVYSAAYEAEE